MPELPDVIVYIERLRAFILGETLHRVRVSNPFLLRSVEPPLGEAEDKRVQTVERIGKRIVLR